MISIIILLLVVLIIYKMDIKLDHDIHPDCVYIWYSIPFTNKRNYIRIVL